MTEEQIAQIIGEVVDREGGYVFSNRKNDLGKHTFAGVLLRTYNAWLRRRGAPALTAAQFEKDARAAAKSPKHPMRENVRTIYREEYIDRFKALPKGLRETIIDAAVNVGWPRAARWLQGVVGAPQDGVVGPITLRRARDLWRQGKAARLGALLAVADIRMTFYVKLARRKPETQLSNLLGWKNRTFDVLREEVEALK